MRSSLNTVRVVIKAAMKADMLTKKSIPAMLSICCFISTTDLGLSLFELYKAIVSNPMKTIYPILPLDAIGSRFSARPDRLKSSRNCKHTLARSTPFTSNEGKSVYFLMSYATLSPISAYIVLNFSMRSKSSSFFG